jgi:CRISPR-associated exonuclease Cas4
MAAGIWARPVAKQSGGSEGGHAASRLESNPGANCWRPSHAGPRVACAGGPAVLAMGVGPMMGMPWVAAAAVLALVMGLMLILGGRGMRQRRGLGGGRTVALDNVTLTSWRYRLTGRPDRLFHEGGMVIPEEWKSSLRVWPNHRAQMGVYFLLIEERFKVRPTHGYIVCGDGTRQRIENDEVLRDWVLELAGQIRAARQLVEVPINVNPKPGQCRPYGMRRRCDQVRL